jgi:hypothetical protein
MPWTIERKHNHVAVVTMKLLRSWTGFLIHLLLMKSGNAENGGSLKGRKNFEICATLSARDRRANSKGAIFRPTNSKSE